MNALRYAFAALHITGLQLTCGGFYLHAANLGLQCRPATFISSGCATHAAAVTHSSEHQNPRSFSKQKEYYSQCSRPGGPSHQRWIASEAQPRPQHVCWRVDLLAPVHGRSMHQFVSQGLPAGRALCAACDARTSSENLGAHAPAAVRPSLATLSTPITRLVSHRPSIAPSYPRCPC